MEDVIGLVGIVSLLGKYEQHVLGCKNEYDLLQAKYLYKRYSKMADVNTDEGRLEALIFFAVERRNIEANITDPVERNRRSTACTAAIRVLNIPFEYSPAFPVPQTVRK